MANGNSVTVVGNLTRDPELRFTSSGQPMATIGIAVNRSWVDRVSNERREVTSFFNIVAWGTLGENAAECLSKGDRVVVTGRLEQRSWETQDGDKRSVVEINADEIGPSLRWATAEVRKNDRRGGDGGFEGGGGGASSRPATNEPPAYELNEEPF